MKDRLPIEYLEAEYNLQIEEIEQMKGTYRLRTNRGKKLLKVWNDQEFLTSAFELREQLVRNDYRKIDRFIRTGTGEPYLQSGESYLVLTDWIEGVIPQVANQEHIKLISRQIAKMHIAFANLNVNQEWEPWSNQFDRGSQHFQKIKDKITTKSKKSTLDEFVLAHLESHQAQINQSIQMATKIEKNSFRSSRMPQLCHGNLELKSFRIDSFQEPWLVQLGMPVVDTTAYDLAKYLMHLYIKSNYQDEILFRALDVYQETLPLQKEEKLWILTYLSYPHHLWKFLYIRYLSGYPHTRFADEQQYLQLVDLQKQLEHLYRSLYQYFRL